MIWKADCIISIRSQYDHTFTCQASLIFMSVHKKSTCEPLKCKMDSPILILKICMVKSFIRNTSG